METVWNKVILQYSIPLLIHLILSYLLNLWLPTWVGDLGMVAEDQTLTGVIFLIPFQ